MSKKLSKKLIKVVAGSSNGEPGLCSVQFNNNEVLLNGFSDLTITPSTALFYVELPDQTPIIHFNCNGNLFSNYKKETITIGINTQGFDTKLYLHLDDSTISFDNQMSLEQKYKIISYFEYDNNSIFIMAFTDLNSDKFIIECISSKNKNTMAFLRTIVKSLLAEECSNLFIKNIQPIFNSKGDICEE